MAESASPLTFPPSLIQYLPLIVIGTEGHTAMMTSSP